MNVRMKNILGLFSDTRTRIILITTFIVIAIAIIVSVSVFTKRVTGPSTSASISSAPGGIDSTPGSENPTIQYQRLQTQANIESAQRAQQTGTSAIPTIIKSTAIKPGQTVDTGDSGLGFQALSRIEGRNSRLLAIENIRKADCSPEAIKQGKQLGLTAKDFKAAGCSACELKNAGFTAAELKAAGFSAAELKGAGFSAKQLKAAGFTPEELVKAGYSPAELEDAGLTANEIQQLKTGLPPGVTAAQIKQAGCNVETLKRERAMGVSADALRRIAGCSAAQMKAAGFTAAELKHAGFTPEELAAAGFSPEQIAKAGFTPAELKKASFTAAELKAAGFTASELKDAGFTPGELKRAGFDDAALNAAGITTQATASTSSLAPALGGADSSLVAAQKRQAVILAQQQSQQQQQQIQSAMSSQASQLFAAWTPATMSFQAGTPPEKQSADGTGGSGSSSSSSTSTRPNLIKAGDIVFAVLDTAVNSDEPGPILATIVSGNLKGAKLIGSLARQESKVLLSFTNLNTKAFPSTISITAVAVDPNTARTALSSSTNHHYLIRYGSLFASSFLSGYGQAVSQAGTTFSTPAGTVTVKDKLTPTQEFFAALGNVGTSFSSQLAPVFSKPPTVKVYSGTSMGILFLADVAMPSTT